MAIKQLTRLELFAREQMRVLMSDKISGQER